MTEPRFDETSCLHWTTLKTIIVQPQWQGVQCLFILDACRLPLEASNAAGVAEFEDGVLLRDPIFAQKTQTANHAPLSLLHSCAEGASAAEIPALRAGIFTQALLDLIKAGQEPPLLFDADFTGQVATRMQAIAATHGVAGLRQQPVWLGAALELTGRAGPQRAGNRAKKKPTRQTAQSTPQQTPQQENSTAETLPHKPWLTPGWTYFFFSLLIIACLLLIFFGPPFRHAAQKNLGDQYYNEKNYVEAAKWYRKAAEQGNPYGQYNLGVMYLQGQGVEKNPVLARIWFQKAADQGYENAKAQLAESNQ